MIGEESAVNGTCGPSVLKPGNQITVRIKKPMPIINNKIIFLELFIVIAMKVKYGSRTPDDVDLEGFSVFVELAKEL